MASPGSHLPPAQPSSGVLQFEVHQKTPQEALRKFLLSVTGRAQRTWRFAEQLDLGLFPHKSIKEKLPYYKAAVEHPEVAAKLSYNQERAIRLHAASAAAGAPPDTSHIRRRPKRARDAFGPGMVFVVNTVLAWLMFSIDVRNAMLR